MARTGAETGDMAAEKSLLTATMVCTETGHIPLPASERTSGENSLPASLENGGEGDCDSGASKAEARGKRAHQDELHRIVLTLSSRKYRIYIYTCVLQIKSPSASLGTEP